MLATWQFAGCLARQRAPDGPQESRPCSLDHCWQDGSRLRSFDGKPGDKCTLFSPDPSTFFVYADELDALALLQVIGADPEAIMQCDGRESPCVNSN